MIELFATFYLTYTFTQTSGIYDLLDKARSRFSKSNSWLGGVLNCYWCASPYFGIAIAVLHKPVEFGESIVTGFALAGGASIMIWSLLFVEDVTRSFFGWLDSRG